MADDDFNIEDVLGTVPGRPNTPDFWRLSEILLAMDGGSEAGSRSMLDDIVSGTYCDTRTMAYVAQQRTLRALAGAGIPTAIQKALMAVWVEGFIVGSEFRKRQVADDA